MLPKALIVNCWDVLYVDRQRDERVRRMQSALGKLLAEAGIDAAPAAVAQICERLTVDGCAAAANHACPPLVQRVMEISRGCDLPIPSQVAAAFARKATQAAVNFAPPSQFPDNFKMLKKLSAHYALVLVGNTTVPAAAGLREVLDGDHLLQYFRATIFSDEFGVGLPAPDLYRAAREFLRLEPRDVWVVAGNAARDLPAAQALRLQALVVNREAAAGAGAAPAGIEMFDGLSALVKRLKAD